MSLARPCAYVASPGSPTITDNQGAVTWTNVAVQVTAVSDTTYRLQTSATTFTSGGNTFPVGAMSWKHFGVVEAWTPYALAVQTAEDARPPTAGTMFSYDMQLTIPALQVAGTYTSTVTYTLIAQP